MMAEAEALNGIFAPTRRPTRGTREGAHRPAVSRDRPGADARYEIDEELDAGDVRR
jgi:hypothetical protein